jgi:hypothetical protein
MQNSDQIGLKTAAQLISDNDKPLAYGYVHDRDVFWVRQHGKLLI